MKLLQNNLKQAEFIRTIWSAKLEPGVTLTDIEAPEFWAHVAKNFKPGDRVEVSPVGNEWFAELYVRAVVDTGVRVFVLRHTVFDEAKPVEEGFEVKHRGGAGWSVLRKSDKAVLVEKLSTRQEAEEWVTQNHMG